MTELVFLKLGGSIITDKKTPNTPQPHIIRQIAAEIKAAVEIKGHNLQLLIGHGSGSFGHAVAAQYRITQGAQNGQSWIGLAQVSAAAARLNRIVMDILLETGLPAINFQPSASALMQNGNVCRLETHPLQESLAHGLIPVIHGDVAFDATQGINIASTESLFRFLGPRLKPNRLLLAGDMDGVFSADPRTTDQATPIPMITRKNWQTVKSALSGSQATDVTGGMYTKVQDMLNLVEIMPPAQALIFAGTKPGNIKKALLNKSNLPGTLIK